MNFRLLSWNILAPCWVRAEWFPKDFQQANQHDERLKKITEQIRLFDGDLVFLQEAQEDTIEKLRENFAEIYEIHVAWNSPSESSIKNGLAVFIRKSDRILSSALVFSGILDETLGESIQIVRIDSLKLNLINVHLNYLQSSIQGSKVLKKSKEILGENENQISLIAGDLNCEKAQVEKFQWTKLRNVFHESIECNEIHSFYPDPGMDLKSSAVDHIFYDPNQLELLSHGKAWSKPDGSLRKALEEIGSDHLYVWANFRSIS